MRYPRLLSVLCLAGVGWIGLGLAWFGSRPAPAGAEAGATPTVITVKAGKPSELAFKLSKSSLIAVGKVTFKVTNAGKLSHDFKVCSTPVATSKASSCKGTGTKLLAPGKSATLTLTLKKGKYEFLCTVPGHAAAGMKGLIGIGVKVTPTPTPTTTSTPVTTTTPTTTSSSTTPLVGDPAAGALVFASAGCAGCHTLAAAGATGNVGPNLDLLHPTQALVVQVVTSGEELGGLVMPAFLGTLNATQINNVAAYVYNSTHH